jgi:hypothetical protein
MARRSSATAVLLLAALVVSASAAAPRHGALFAGAGGEAEQLAANSPAACKTCLVAFRVLDDLLCDPAAEDVLVRARQGRCDCLARPGGARRAARARFSVGFLQLGTDTRLSLSPPPHRSTLRATMSAP